MKRIISELALTAGVVGVAMLMQKPALRQALLMRLTHYGKVFCQVQADAWQHAATACASAYHKARL